MSDPVWTTDSEDIARNAGLGVFGVPEPGDAERRESQILGIVEDHDRRLRKVERRVAIMLLLSGILILVAVISTVLSR